MFAKPAKVSGNVLLKNKDVKKLRRDVADCFKSTCDGPDDVNLKQLLASKASVKKMSFQAPSRVVVFAAEETKEPLVFDITGKGDLCLSVYALWRAPALLPPLVVHAPVSEFVLRGADVMLPGVVFTSVEQLQSLRKGELRAVYARGNPCAIGVGDRVVPVGDIEEDNGVTLEGIKLEDEESKEVETMEEEVTKEQMDSYYVAALLQALRTSRIREKELPMLASSFHANVLLPCRRAGVSLNIKHSSFKKLSVFLKGMAAHGLLAVDDNDGVQSITAISRRHPDVLSHEAYQTDEEAQQEEQAAANKAAGLPAFVPGQYAPEVEESIGLSPALKTLLPSILPSASAGQPLQKYWSPVEIRDLVTQYVESQGLVDTGNKKFVRLNGPLTDALYGKKAPPGGYPERLARPEILELLLSKCTRYHRIKLFPTHAAKFHGGNLRPITIHAEKLKRRNNTTVTCIAFYQQFGIDGATFAKEAQKKWGCSAAVQTSEDKSKGEEIQIHGQMVNEVLEYLSTKYRINVKYCSVTYGKDVKAKKKK
ncbi:Ligatin [Phytophthora palmivora]|uniref:Ligatin n=1 Tax=Phytophthora palmivora TaxID=4796 RepID=A0A2P4XRP5_9STRA|nr:Ligatin [Phytophthora palmivora]